MLISIEELKIINKIQIEFNIFSTINLPVNFVCHCKQWTTKAFFNGEQSTRTNWTVVNVSRDCTLLATSV